MFHINHFIPSSPRFNTRREYRDILVRDSRGARQPARPSNCLPILSHPSNVNIQGNKKKNIIIIINNFIAENKKKCRRKGRKLKINSHFHYFPLLLLLPNVYVKWYNVLCCVFVLGIRTEKKRKDITLCYVMTLAIWKIMLRNRLRLELELKVEIMRTSRKKWSDETNKWNNTCLSDASTFTLPRPLPPTTWTWTTIESAMLTVVRNKKSSTVYISST